MAGKLERGTRKEDPISVYLFGLAFEVTFALINANSNVEGLQFLSHTFLYSAYADDTTCFLRKEKLALELINLFDTFSLFFWS